MSAVQDRPTDYQLIMALALHFRVNPFKIIRWLQQADWEGAQAYLAALESGAVV